MVMYNPTFLSPNNTPIDATAENIFTWQTEGSLPQVAFQLFIRRNNDNTSLYDSTKIVSSTPSHSILANVLSNSIYENKWKVRIWWDETNYVDSDWVIVKANATPTLTLNVAASLSEQNPIFIGTYSQAQNIPVKQFKYLLFGDFIGISDLIYDTGWIYSQDIQHEIKGLINGQNYEIKAVAINQHEQIVESPTYSFSTQYNIPGDIPDLDTVINNNLGAVTLDWISIQQRLGIVNGTYEYVDGVSSQAAYLHQGTTLRYFNEPLPLDFTNIFHLKLPANFQGILMIKGGQFGIGYDGTRFYYQNNWRITAGKPITLPTGFFKVGIKQNEIIIITDTTTDIIV